MPPPFPNWRPSWLPKSQDPELNTNTSSETELLNCFEVLTYPVEATGHDSPNLLSNVMLAGIVAAVITYGICLIRFLLRSRISTEDDIKRILDYPLIGSIPSWDSPATK